MRYIDPETLDPYFDGRPGYGEYLQAVWDQLPSGVIALVDAVFHDGLLKFVGEGPSDGALRFCLENYVGNGNLVYQIMYTGVIAVERIDPWPGPVMPAGPPYRQWFEFDDGDGLAVHRDEIHMEPDGLFEHRLMTLGGTVRIIRFGNVEVICHPA